MAKSQDAKLEDDPSSNHAMTVGLQFSAMPLPLSSFIAFSFLGRFDNPMPRKTFGALERFPKRLNRDTPSGANLIQAPYWEEASMNGKAILGGFA